MFDNSTIIPLRGPDRVRKRPAVIFGSAGIEGAVCAVIGVLDIFIAEAVGGLSDGLCVTIHQDGSVTLLSYDRGFQLSDEPIDGKPAWHYAFCELFACSRAPEEDYRFQLGKEEVNYYGTADAAPLKYPTMGWHSTDLCAAQYASRYMQVEAVRDGVKKTLRFEKGFPVSALEAEPTDERSYTRIHFALDTEVFEDTALPCEEIARFLQASAVPVSELRCTFTDERNGFSAQYHYPRELEDYAAETATAKTPFYVDEIEATGKERYNAPEYSAKIRLLFAFVEHGGGVQCFHNYRPLPYGGTHVQAIQEKLMTLLEWDFKECAKRISANDLQDRLLLLIDTKSTHTRYENGAKTSINNRMITDMASDLIGDNFRYYLKQNRETILSLLK